MRVPSITDADIIMYPTIELRTTLDAHTAILHELGHVVGLDHSQYGWALMASSLSANWRQLSSDEVQFMTDIYGYPPPCSGCNCPCGAGDSWIESYKTAFRMTIDSTLYARGTAGEQWALLAASNTGEAVQILSSSAVLLNDVRTFLIQNESFALSQTGSSPEMLTRNQMTNASGLLYRIADGSSPQLQEAIFKIVAVLDQSEGKTFKQTIEDVLRGVTIPWDQIIQWLMQNYPNPFNPTTTIRYRVTSPGHVSLKVFDIVGREIATLAEGYHVVGIHQADFDGSKYASGIYFYQLVAPGRSEVKKMILTK